MEIIAMTDIGNVRSINQDYVRYYQKDNQETLVVLCDGMGGHNAGEIASQMVCDDIIERYQDHDLFQNDNDIQTWTNEIINHAHQRVKEKSHESSELEGMGTTVVLALFKGDDVYVSHVGDSRAYMFKNQELLQLTKDDTLVNVLVDSGTISQDEALIHPQKNILLQAVGVSDVLKISFIKKEFKESLILICSDGLYNSLSEEQLVDILQKKVSLEMLGKELMNAANTFGVNDNIGFAMIRKEGVVDNEPNQ